MLSWWIFYQKVEDMEARGVRHIASNFTTKQGNVTFQIIK
jgi:hypothetical protein